MDKIDHDNIEPPALWGDMRQHIDHLGLFKTREF